MNLAVPSLNIVNYAFQFWRALLKALPKQNCQTFGVQSAQKPPRIEKIYVINLEREPGRWFKMRQELRQILDSSGGELLSLTERYVAVDAMNFLGDPALDADIDPFYTLEDQLFVEPQPLVSPADFELNAPIRMSRAEIAVARSHINVWRQVAASNHAYALILEDDVWFHRSFARDLDEVWHEVVGHSKKCKKFDILYLSYCEAKYGAPKTSLSDNVFRPLRGLWHLSGYILSREGAERLLQMLPCRGPIDLWMNHKFEVLEVRAVNKPIIYQRRDTKSTNTYSILPSLTNIGAINSERASSFNIRPTEKPVFVFGPQGSGHTSLAMALSMLGYRCCSDLEDLPSPELERLLEQKKGRVFDAYVNIGSLDASLKRLRGLYPSAKFLLTTADDVPADDPFRSIWDDLRGADIAVLHVETSNKWRVLCEHLRCAPPISSFPKLRDIGRRPAQPGTVVEVQEPKFKRHKWDKSPWVVEPRKWWRGIRPVAAVSGQGATGKFVQFNDYFEILQNTRWVLRNDTFTDNLALFRPSNVALRSGSGVELSVKSEALGVRDYSAASISSRDQYLFGKFEANMQASKVPGVITGFFLHRNSPRQEIDIEIGGHRPDQLLVNVFFNPGDDGAKFDYGYRGTPCVVSLGFDASEAYHRYTIEWSPCEILWKVDGRLVHRRGIWDPTPIPHLPMTLHINSWPTRSFQLAGRIDKRRLPGSALLGSVSVNANSVSSPPGPNFNNIF